MSITTNKPLDFHQAIHSKQRIFREEGYYTIEENKIITRERELEKTFNEYYINIVDKSSG